MTILSDDLVEKAARAAYADLCRVVIATLEPDPPPREWEDLKQQERDHWRSRARAALEAALPGIVEECAKVAEDFGPCNPGANHTSAGIKIALAIRNLKPKEEGNG